MREPNGLVNSSDEESGSKCHRRGKVYSFMTPEGDIVTKLEEILRTKALDKRPAYRDVRHRSRDNGQVDPVKRKLSTCSSNGVGRHKWLSFFFSHFEGLGISERPTSLSESVLVLAPFMS